MADLSVAHYRVLEKIGEGGMGVVYRAEDPRLGRMVALKALPSHLCADPAYRRRFQQEARAAAALNHNAIATIYDLEQDGDDIFIVMEYVEGETLRSLLREGPLPGDALISIAVQVAQGLAAAHEHGIIHRDLKPENILRTASGQVKILDFGLCRLVPVSQELTTESLHLTDPGMVLGTLAYMSPEQLEARETDHRTDIFSFGVVLYELATGVHPFAGTSAASTIANVLTVEPIPLGQLNVGVPSALGDVINRCIRKRPEQRYSSVLELLRDLEEVRQRIDSGQPGKRLEPQPSGGLLGWLSPVQLTARQWWEGNQLLCLLAFPLIGYLAWRLREWMPVDWAAILIASMVVLVAATTTLRMYLLLTAVFDPSSLPTEVRRWSLGLRVAGSAIWVLLATAAVTFLRGHTGVAVLVCGLAIGGFVSTVVAEAAIDRKAFP